MRRILTALVLATCGFASAVEAAPSSYTSFFAFGDSLSDGGNLFAASGFPPAPYANGRFSNGPVWADTVAAGFASQGKPTANLAFGGANAITNGDLVPDLELQLGLFSLFVPPSALGSHPLASLWFGSNDVFDLVDGGAPDLVASANAVADQVALGAFYLASVGIGDLVVMNLPDLGRIPRYALLDPAHAANATLASNAFNARLANNIAGLRFFGLNIIDIDIHGLFDDLLANPASYGVLNTTFPCYLPGVWLCSPDEAALSAFFDPNHPTAGLHQRIADIVNARIAPVPLPLPLALFAAGVSGLGLIRRRRQA